MTNVRSSNVRRKLTLAHGPRVVKGVKVRVTAHARYVSVLGCVVRLGTCVARLPVTLHILLTFPRLKYSHPTVRHEHIASFAQPPCLA
jgi:hypothetical protein